MKKSIRSVFLAFVFLTVLVSGCAPAPTPAPTPTPVPPTFTPEPTPSLPALEIFAGRDYVSDDDFNIVGEVVNNTDKWYEQVEINATFYDTNGKILGSDYTFIALDLLPPKDKVPFHLWSDVGGSASSVVSYTLQVAGNDSTSIPYQGLEIVSEREYKDSIGSHIAGDVNNTGPSDCEFTKIVYTLYNEEGKVVDVDYTYTGGILLSQKSSPFSLYLRGLDVKYDHYRLWVECQPTGTSILSLVATPGSREPVTAGDLIFLITKVDNADTLNDIQGQVSLYEGNLESTDNGWMPQFHVSSNVFLIVFATLQSGDYQSFIDIDPTLLIEGDSAVTTITIFTQVKENRVIWVYDVKPQAKSFSLILPDNIAIDLTPLIP